MEHKVSEERYKHMDYVYCGRSGLQLPKISLGLWHNFGDYDDFNNATNIIRYAFDKGITHFDLANNYGPEPGAAECNFGKILQNDFKSHRDEMIISTKAGYKMWDGPYNDGGSRKYLMSSLDQSLRRMKLDYVDIFYSHRFDPFTPIEETMQALIDIVKQGKALYVGISNYPEEDTRKALWILNESKTPCLIYQGKYNMFHKQHEHGIFGILNESGVGYIAFSPLAQGLLTDKYLQGIPEKSRAANPKGFLKKEHVTDDIIEKATRLNKIARERGQSLSQMAIAWTLRNNNVTSSLIGASSVNQLKNNLEATKNTFFSDKEIWLINEIIN